MNAKLKKEFLDLYNRFKNNEITQQQYIEMYFNIGKQNNKILYFPVLK